MESDAPGFVVIYGIDLIRRIGKAVAGLAVAIDAGDFLRGFAKEVIQFIVRLHPQHIADIPETGLLCLNNQGQVPLGGGVFIIVKEIVFAFILFHGEPP